MPTGIEKSTLLTSGSEEVLTARPRAVAFVSYFALTLKPGCTPSLTAKPLVTYTLAR